MMSAHTDANEPQGGTVSDKQNTNRILKEIVELATKIQDLANVDWTKLYDNDIDEMIKLAGMLGSVRAKAGIIRTKAEVAGMTHEEIRNALRDLASVGSKS